MYTTANSTKFWAMEEIKIHLWVDWIALEDDASEIVESFNKVTNTLKNV